MIRSARDGFFPRDGGKIIEIIEGITIADFPLPALKNNHSPKRAKFGIDDQLGSSEAFSKRRREPLERVVTD